MTSEIPFTPLYINAQWVPSSNGTTFEVRQPGTNDLVGMSASATSADCKAAIEAAAKAFKTWERSNVSTRRDILLKAADLATQDKYRDKIVESIMAETGASRDWSIGPNWAAIPTNLRGQASLSDRLKGDIYPSASAPGAQVIAQRRAKGVILSIAPWNAPVILSLRAITVPILCGNTVVLKSSELSPRSQSVVCELFEEAGLPPGVLNYISVRREDAPALTAEMIAHPAVRSVNFTGSDRVGKIIAVEAAKNLKPCVLELGGNAPAVVLDDANIEEAAKAIIFGGMIHSGQVCMSTQRVIVQSTAAEPLLSQLKSLLSGIKAAGLPDPPNARLGPLFTSQSASNIVDVLKNTQAAGAQIVYGDLDKDGYVVQPHVVTGVKPGMALWEREIFGPVLAVAVVDTVDEAIDLANATDYSLSASVWTRDVWAGQEVASKIHSGYTHVNGPTVHTEPGDGLVGLGGSSGYGRFNIEDFTDKRVTILHGSAPRTYPLFS